MILFDILILNSLLFFIGIFAGACTIKAPKINSKIELLDEGGKCWLEWERSEKCLAKLLQDVDSNKSKPLMKYTIPGPMTLVDVLFDDFYGENNKREMIEDLINCVNKVIQYKYALQEYSKVYKRNISKYEYKLSNCNLH